MCQATGVIVCTAAQDWEMEKHEMPFVFDNFKSLAEQQGYLPPELVGALQRVQVTCASLLCMPRVPRCFEHCLAKAPDLASSAEVTIPS